MKVTERGSFTRETAIGRLDWAIDGGGAVPMERPRWEDVAGSLAFCDEVGPAISEGEAGKGRDRGAWEGAGRLWLGRLELDATAKLQLGGADYGNKGDRIRETEAGTDRSC